MLVPAKEGADALRFIMWWERRTEPGIPLSIDEGDEFAPGLCLIVVDGERFATFAQDYENSGVHPLVR